MNIEVGKWYELNNGEKHQCTKIKGDGFYVLGGFYYHSNGVVLWGDKDSPRSVKRELPEEVDLTKINTPFGLLSEGTQQRLRDWPHGLEVYGPNGWTEFQWRQCPTAPIPDVTYRAKLAPESEKMVYWLNVYPDGVRVHQSKEEALRARDRECIATECFECDPDGSNPTIYVEETE